MCLNSGEKYDSVSADPISECLEKPCIIYIRFWPKLSHIVGVGEVIFRFAMLNIPLRGAYRFTKRPSKSAYLRELGLIFNKNQKLLKNFT